MNIYLGNMTIDDMEIRMGIKFPEELKGYMNVHHQDIADTHKLLDSEWHCFDIPFVIVCGSIEVATRIYNDLKPFVSEIKTPLQIAIREGKP